MKKLAEFVVRRRWWIVATWVIAAILIITLSPQLSSVESNSQSSFLPNKYESVQAGNVAKEINPNVASATDVIVFQNKDHSKLSSADQQTIQSIVNKLNTAQLPHVQSVTTASAEIAPNHKAQLAQLAYAGNAEDTKVINSVAGIRSKLKSLTSGTDLTAGLTGGEATSYDTQDSYNNALKIVSIGTILLILILPALVFRSVLSGLLPVLSVGLVYSVASSLIADAAKLFDFKVNQQLSVLFTVVLFGVGTDYILFLLFRYRERLKTGSRGQEAMVYALTHAGEAILSAALVVISSFIALFFAKFGIFHTFAPGLVICVGLMLIAALTFVPAIVSILGPRIFWPSKAWSKPTADAPTVSKRLGRLISNHPVLMGGGVFIILIAIALGALGYKADFSSFSQPPANTPSATAYNAVTANFPAGASSPTLVYVKSTTPLTAASLQPLTSRLQSANGVAAASPPVITANQRYATYSLELKSNPYSQQAFKAISGPIHTAAHGITIPNAHVYVGGVTAALVDVQSATDRDMRVVFPIAALFIFVILSLLLRSLVAPIFLLISVGLGFGATLGATVLIFMKAGSDNGLIFFLPILLYIFVVAIGTDYNILTITRLREEVRSGLKPREAADLTVEHSSATVASAGLILAGTFASLMLAGIGLLSQMGAAIALGVILAAFIIAPVVIPSVSVIVGYAIWWPGHKPGSSKKTS